MEINDVPKSAWRWPCLWTLCNIVANRHGREPPDTLVDENLQAKVFPRFSAAELLKEPLMARMAGLQLKRECQHTIRTHQPYDIIMMIDFAL